MTGTCSDIRMLDSAGNGAATIRSCTFIFCLFSMVLTGAAQSETEYAPATSATKINSSPSPCVDGRTGRIEIVSRDRDGIFLDREGRRYLASDLRQPVPGFELGTSSFRQVSDKNTSLKAIPLGEPNRWGLTPAWIVMQNGEEESLLQEEMLHAGTALFAPASANHTCAELLRSAEKKARRSRSGLWNGSAGARVLQAAALKSFADKAGQYVIARGRIVSLGKTRSTRYLNFGRYWKTDLTVTFRSSDEDMFNEYLSLSGWQVEELAGHIVEVRGVLQEKDGPFIALRHPGQLMVLERKRAGRGGRYSN